MMISIGNGMEEMDLLENGDGGDVLVNSLSYNQEKP